MYVNELLRNAIIVVKCAESAFVVLCFSFPFFFGFVLFGCFPVGGECLYASELIS